MEGNGDVSSPVGLKAKFWGIRPFKRHSLVVIVAGVAYILHGLNYILSDLNESRREALSIALSWFPIQFWGTVFVASGILAVISARWPPVAERWGYMLLTGLSAGWGATYATGVIFEHSPTSNFSGALNWGLLAFLWWGVSGLVNPDKTVVVVIKDDGSGSDC